MIEKWKTAADNGDVFAALQTDLSKAFDCISHDLRIADISLISQVMQMLPHFIQLRKTE